MKVVALIPARFNSQRFPGKLLKDLLGESIIWRTYKAALQSDLFEAVWVITDSDAIFDEIKERGGKVLKSRQQHATGTDRIAEFAKDIEADIFINIQGDEPFINANQIQSLIDVFEQDDKQASDMASLMTPIVDKASFLNPNNVKVVTDQADFAMYFSRAPIPFSRDHIFEKAHKHIGVYAFRKQSLMRIAVLPQTDLEKIEKLENLRFIQNGLKIKMIRTNQVNFGIDTPEDLQKAIAYLKNNEDE